eukprot:CAMPEP_0198520646 /NCGR_PEP_ID=MMETSP1462-20131121/20453_1 /TAXON_ID=1333877 /ORGANISM="Brandtodinium nutriculum, Strain RCC3387" /LENGTH=49 /DNA_ID= /DNA_START= /DNA_END= /DNA_ORIENTATION=
MVQHETGILVVLYRLAEINVENMVLRAYAQCWANVVRRVPPQGWHKHAL